MKTCVECHASTPDLVLTCAACGSGLFVDEAKPPVPARTESVAASLAKWALGYVLFSVLVGMASTVIAHILLRNGFRNAAEGIAYSPNVFIPLGTVLFFAFYSSRTSRPVMRASALYGAITILGLGLHLMTSAPPGQYLAAAVIHLVFAVVGTGIGLFFRTRGDIDA